MLGEINNKDVCSLLCYGVKVKEGAGEHCKQIDWVNPVWVRGMRCLVSNGDILHLPWHYYGDYAIFSKSNYFL